METFHERVSLSAVSIVPDSGIVRPKDVVGQAGRRWRRGTERASCCLTGSRESEARLYVGVTLPYAYLHRLAPSFAGSSPATGPRDR